MRDMGLETPTAPAKPIEARPGHRVRRCQVCDRMEEPDEKFKSCSKCRARTYCGECQRADWHTHKFLCKPAPTKKGQKEKAEEEGE